MTIAIPAWVPRNDLSLLKWTRPALIATRLLPTLTLSKKQDVVVYMPQRDNTLAPQTGRAMGGVFSLNTIANVREPIDLTASEVAFTDIKDLSDVTEMGDLEVSMRQLAFQGKPAVAYAVEVKLAKALMDGKAAIATTGEIDLIKTLREKRQLVASQLGDGMIVAAMSQATFNTVIMMAKVQEQIGKAVSIPVSQAVSAANLARIQLAAILGVDEVLVGQNRAWMDSSIVQKDAILVAVIPEPGVDPKIAVQLGRAATFVNYVSEPTPADGNTGKEDYDDAYMITGSMSNKQYATPFVCSQWAYGIGGAVALTIQSFVEPVIFNTNLFEVIALPAGSSYSASL